MSKIAFQDNKYVFREYGGYIFKMPVNEDIRYLSVEKQNQYYWYLAEAMFNHIIPPARHNQNSVSHWELGGTNSGSKVAKFQSFSDLKKQHKIQFIGYALGRIHSIIDPGLPTTTGFQYIENIRIS